MSLAGPKPRPGGVGDGSLVDIPEPGQRVDHAGTRLKFPSRDWLSVLSADIPRNRETGRYEWIRKVKRSGDGCRREKPCGSVDLTVPQTDTGRQVEDTKAFEITIVKELGNLTP